MKSPFLEDFLKNFGSAVHSINTLCVGLSSIETGNYVKPEDLTIKWETTDNKSSARKARIFALKGALVYMDDSFSVYLKDIRELTHNAVLKAILLRKNPQHIEELAEVFKKEHLKIFNLFNKKNEPDKKYINIDSSDRIRALESFFTFEELYWIPCALLLNKWRNRVVHSKSTAQLYQNEIKNLTDNSEKIRLNHANIDINRTLSDFDKNEITLKDITTLIAITIRLVRHIDNAIYAAANDIRIVEAYVKRRGLVNMYNSIVKFNNETVRKRKFAKFITTYISHLEYKDINYIYNDIKLIEL